MFDHRAHVIFLTYTDKFLFYFNDNILFVHKELNCIVFHQGDAPTLVRVNLYLRSISKIDDYNMVSCREACVIQNVT